MIKNLRIRLAVWAGTRCPCHGEKVYWVGNGSRAWCKVTEQRITKKAYKAGYKGYTSPITIQKIKAPISL